jgi:hypothetical protein
MNDFLIDCSFKSYSTGPKFDKFIQRWTTHFVYFSSNSQRFSKIFENMNQGPKWGCLMTKKTEVENLVTLSL